MIGTLMKTTTLMLCLALCAAPALAAPTAKEVAAAQQTLNSWFAGYEFVPDQSHYKRLGEALPHALRAIVADEDGDLIKRARAVSAMLYAPSPLIEALLVQLVENEAQESLLRRKGLLVLANSYGAEHAPLVYNVWVHSPDDLRLREACAHALRDMGPAGYGTRDSLLRLEKAPTVRAILNRDKTVEGPK